MLWLSCSLFSRPLSSFSFSNHHSVLHFSPHLTLYTHTQIYSNIYLSIYLSIIFKLKVHLWSNSWFYLNSFHVTNTLSFSFLTQNLSTQPLAHTSPQGTVEDPNRKWSPTGRASEFWDAHWSALRCTNIVWHLICGQLLCLTSPETSCPPKTKYLICDRATYIALGDTMQSSYLV